MQFSRSGDDHEAKWGLSSNYLLFEFHLTQPKYHVQTEASVPGKSQCEGTYITNKTITQTSKKNLNYRSQFQKLMVTQTLREFFEHSELSFWLSFFHWDFWLRLSGAVVVHWFSHPDFFCNIWPNEPIGIGSRPNWIVFAVLSLSYFLMVPQKL